MSVWAKAGKITGNVIKSNFAKTCSDYDLLTCKDVSTLVLLLTSNSPIQYGSGGGQVLEGDSQRLEDGDVVGRAVLGVGRVDPAPDDGADLAHQNVFVECLLADLAALNLWTRGDKGTLNFE